MNRQPKIYIFCAGGNVQGVRVSNLPSEVEVEIIDKDDLGQDDDERAEWDIDAFADAIRAHFADDKQVLEVVSAGNEKLCYVAAQRLVITATTVTFEDWYAGN